MKHVTLILTEDGSLFDREGDAETHEKLLRLEEQYYSNKLFDKHFAPSFDELLRWMSANRELAEEMLHRAKCSRPQKVGEIFSLSGDNDG